MKLGVNSFKDKRVNSIKQPMPQNKNSLSISNDNMRRRASINMNDFMKVEYKGDKQADNIIGSFGAPDQPDFK